MNEDGKTLLEAIRYIRKFMEQIALLGQTADKLFGQNGWECIHGNTSMYNTSWSIQSPKNWIPKFTFRFYMDENKSRNEIINFSIILDDVDNSYKNFKEPLITAGLLKSDKSKKYETIKKSYHYFWSQFYVWDHSEADGEIKDDFRNDWDEDDKKNYPYLESTHLLAYPLVEISSEEDLNKKIVEPIINLL